MTTMTPTNGGGDRNDGTSQTGSPKKKKKAIKYYHRPWKAGRGGRGRRGRGGSQIATLTNDKSPMNGSKRGAKMIKLPNQACLQGQESHNRQGFATQVSQKLEQTAIVETIDGGQVTVDGGMRSGSSVGTLQFDFSCFLVMLLDDNAMIYQGQERPQPIRLFDTSKPGDLEDDDVDRVDKGERDDKWAIKTVRRIWKIPWTHW